MRNLIFFSLYQTEYNTRNYTEKQVSLHERDVKGALLIMHNSYTLIFLLSVCIKIRTPARFKMQGMNALHVCLAELTRSPARSFTGVGVLIFYRKYRRVFFFFRFSSPFLHYEKKPRLPVSLGESESPAVFVFCRGEIVRLKRIGREISGSGRSGEEIKEVNGESF